MVSSKMFGQVESATSDPKHVYLEVTSQSEFNRSCFHVDDSRGNIIATVNYFPCNFFFKLPELIGTKQSIFK